MPEFRVRAERKCGEMLIESAENGMRASGGRPEKQSQAATVSPTLSQIGITKSDSSRYQALAAIPPEHFETAIDAAKAAAGFALF